MTEKRDLNNELILMKKTIQQAKVCVIGKLVRKLKNLANGQGKESKKLIGKRSTLTDKINHHVGKELTGLKLIGKRSRLTDQINYLKKTPNSELASLALTFDRNPAKILTNNLSSIQDAALANLVTFKTIDAKINQIKTKLALNDKGEEWREKINEIGKKKKKKIEKETHQSRKKERKEANKKHSELLKKRDEWLEGNDDRVPTDKEDNSEATLVVKSEKNSKKIDNKTKMLTKTKSTPEPLKIVDSFFVTGTGESYLATKIIDRIQPSGPNDGLDRKERRAQQFSGNKPKTISRSHAPPAAAGPSSSMKSMATPDEIHPSWAAKMKSKGIDKFQGKKMKFDDEEASDVVSKNSTSQPKEDSEKIHPSWAAKQKLKPVISEFKGSKIVFDD